MIKRGQKMSLVKFRFFLQEEMSYLKLGTKTGKLSNLRFQEQGLLKKELEHYWFF